MGRQCLSGFILLRQSVILAANERIDKQYELSLAGDSRNMNFCEFIVKFDL